MNRFIFTVELKKGTRKKYIWDRVSDVQQRLQLSTLYVMEKELIIYIVASVQKMDYPHLPDSLSTQEYKESSKDMELPYVIGHDVAGELIIDDLNNFLHLLVAGASGSGKTVGLQALIICIIYSIPPQRVNFILIDVGATDLISFNGVPHLSCPVVSERQTACRVLILLMDEMERRIKLKASNSNQFEQLPRLVLVVDEFPAIFTGVEDKQMVRQAVNAVSNLLQRGRHAKIHVVLAAQNPTIQNMKVDLGNITARMAFRCAKKNFSETIIGESGAENLLGKGDMLFKSPQFERPRRIQGAYISPEELQKSLSIIKDRWRNHDIKYKFTISEADLQQTKIDIMANLTGRPSMRKTDINNHMFAEILLWALEQDTISCNLLMRKFNIGWKRANEFMTRLNTIGVVEDLDTKLPRKVLKHSAKDFSEEQINFLMKSNVLSEKIMGIPNIED